MRIRRPRATPAKATEPEVVTLADLAPRHEVRGGGSRRVFGADAPRPGGALRSKKMTRKSKDSDR
jgi:hypothetical protein